MTTSTKEPKKQSYYIEAGDLMLLQRSSADQQNGIVVMAMEKAHIGDAHLIAVVVWCPVGSGFHVGYHNKHWQLTMFDRFHGRVTLES